MKLRNFEIVAILRDVKPEDAPLIVGTLLENDIKFIEVSLSNEKNGFACIEKILKKTKPTFNLGVGTVTRLEQIKRVQSYGLKYIITPGWDEDLVTFSKSLGLDIIPGVFSPSEIMQALKIGITLVKLFPAGVLGEKYIKALFGPFPNIRIMAVGEVNKSNIESLYKAGCLYFGIGSDLVPRGATIEVISQIKINAIKYSDIVRKWRNET